MTLGEVVDFAFLKHVWKFLSCFSSERLQQFIGAEFESFVRLESIDTVKSVEVLIWGMVKILTVFIVKVYK